MSESDMKHDRPASGSDSKAAKRPYDPPRVLDEVCLTTFCLACPVPSIPKS